MLSILEHIRHTARENPVLASKLPKQVLACSGERFDWWTMLQVVARFCTLIRVLLYAPVWR